MRPELLKANRIKLSRDYAIKNLMMYPSILFVLGLAVYIFADPIVNQNQVFGEHTLFQAATLFITFILARKTKYSKHFVIGAFVFVVLYVTEFIMEGMPNDFLKAYYVHGPARQVRTPHKVNGLVFLMAHVFPYVYVIVKLIIAILVWRPYYLIGKYDALSPQIKVELEELK